MTIPFSLPPVIERELRVASRRPATYWSRVGAAASGGVIVCWVGAAQLVATRPAAAGQFTFRLLAGIAAFTVVASVLQLSSEAFAREKREDTLGLLFLTPLQPIDLVLGKLVSTSLAAFYRFLTIVPFLALPMLLGGVRVQDFVLLVLALINVVFLGANLGLYVSARSWDEKRATTIATIIMFCLVVLPAIALVVSRVLNRPDIFSIFALSPGYPIWQATVSSGANAGLFWASLLWTHLLGWIFFRAACRTLPRCWQNRPINLAPRGDHLQPRREEERQAFRTAPNIPPATVKIRRTVRRQFAGLERARMLDHYPVLWFALRWRPHSAGVWIIGAILLVSCVPAILLGLSEGIWGLFFAPGFALYVFFCVNLAFKTYAATHAGFAFARDRGENPLELLLSTPITPRQLIHGYALALRETIGAKIRWALWIEGIWLTLTIYYHATHGGQDTFLYVLASLAMLGFLVPDLHAVGWTAMWQGVIARNAREAEKEAFSRVMVLPWLGTFMAWPVGMSIAGPLGGLLAAILVWIIFSAAANWWFARQARRNLETTLGLWALRRAAGEFENYDGWRRLGRWLAIWWKGAAKQN
jgi:ABC-type Na+ efflux pump permease subunit